MKTIVVGSRGSKLAMIQTESVLNTMKQVHPEIEFTLTKITTKGDRMREVRLDQLPGVGVFVKELEAALLDGQIDMAVHSFKDMPTAIPPGLLLAGVTMRLDPRDALVSGKGKLHQLAPGSRIGTGSPRRRAQLLRCRPDLKVEMVRGNVDTRLRKISSGQLDGVIVAAAAMLRLGCEETIAEYLSLEDFLPAAGQGALGIEIRSGDTGMAGLVAMVNHQPTWCSVIAERAFLHVLGGGCRAPIAALGQVIGVNLKLDGMVADTRGHVFLHASEEGSASDAERVGFRLGKKMWRMGASQLITEARMR